MIEFDVLPEDLDAREHGAAACSRTTTRTTSPRAPTLEEGLDAPRRPRRSPAIELDVDLKLPGYEARVVDALRAHGLVERTLVSTQYMRSLVDAARARAGAAARLVGAARQARLHPLAAVRRCPPTRCCVYVRRRLPGVARRAHRGGPLRRGDVPLRARHAARCWRPSRGAGGELYVWTVDDARRDPRARGARRHRRDHQRPAAVRGAQPIEQVAARVARGSAPAVERWPASVIAAARRTTRPSRRHGSATTPRKVIGRRRAARTRSSSPTRRAARARGPSLRQPESAPRDVAPARRRRGTGRGSASQRAARAACRASTRGCRPRSGAARVSHTLTVAHRSAAGARGGGAGSSAGERSARQREASAHPVER